MAEQSWLDTVSIHDVISFMIYFRDNDDNDVDIDK